MSIEERGQDFENEKINLLKNKVDFIWRMPDAVIYTDLRYRVKGWNKGAERMYGWEASEAIDQNFSDLVVSEFLDGASEEDVRREISEKGYWAGELLQLNKHGKTLRIHSCSTLIRDDDDNPIGFVGVNRDLTDSISLQKEKMNILDNIPISIVKFDKDMNVKCINKELVKRIGKPSSEIIGKSWYDVLPGMKKRESIYKKVLKGNSVDSWSAKVQMPAGTKFFDVRYRPTFDLRNQVDGMIAIALDVTKRIETESETQTLRDRLRLQKAGLKANERAILAALAVWPDISDKKLSECTMTKQSTVTAIRRRLSQQNWFTKIIVPDLVALGMEIICVWYHYDTSQIAERRAVRKFFLDLQNRDECIFAQIGKPLSIGLTAHRNSSEAYHEIREFVTEESHKLNIRTVKFLVSATSFHKFLNYSNLVQEVTGHSFKSDNLVRKKEKLELTKNEKELMYAFAKFPGATNAEIRKRTYLSKPTIIKIKKRLFDEKLLKSAIVPDLNKLGMTAGCMTLVDFGRPMYGERSAIDAITEFNEKAAFSVASDQQILFVNHYQDLSKASKENQKFCSEFQEKFQTLEQPRFMQFRESNILKLNYSGLIKKAFKLDLRY